jgi:Tol biopolymer transport system component
MRKLLFSILLFGIVSSNLFGQNIKVGETIRLTNKNDGIFMSPKVSPTGTIFFSSQGYTGIYFIDKETNLLTKLNDELGAGYEFTFSPDGKNVIYRSDRYINGLKYSTLKEQNIVSKEIRVLQDEARNMDVPKVMNDGKVVFGIDEKLQILSSDRVSKVDISLLIEPVVKAVNNEIVIYNNGIRRTIQPLGDRYYVWTSISPDMTKLLFYAVGKGAYISDLNGSLLAELGDIRYPQWSPNGDWVSYMLDEDDGERLLRSDIRIISSDGKVTHQITSTNEIKEIYPVWNGSNLVYADDEGMIYTTYLSFE